MGRKTKLKKKIIIQIKIMLILQYKLVTHSHSPYIYGGSHKNTINKICLHYFVQYWHCFHFVSLITGWEPSTVLKLHQLGSRRSPELWNDTTDDRTTVLGNREEPCITDERVSSDLYVNACYIGREFPIWCRDMNNLFC